LLKKTIGVSVKKIMNDFFIILLKTIIFIISFIFFSKIVLSFLKKRNPAAERWDIEVIAVTTIFAAIITAIFKHIIKFFI
jgi:energy-converting hydrogenase Eha subunit A